MESEREIEDVPCILYMNLVYFIYYLYYNYLLVCMESFFSDKLEGIIALLYLYSKITERLKPPSQATE